jgi:hypothetical protein
VIPVRWAIGVLCVLGPAAAPPASADTVQLTTSYRGTAGLTAYGGHVVWSQFDPATRLWSLQQWHAGKQSRLPARAREEPFDADAGPDARGRPVVVYSRCAIESSRPLELPAPHWADTRGCHVYELRLDGHGREHRIDRLFRPEASDTVPTIWRGRIAFARQWFRRSVRIGKPHVLLSDGARVRRMAVRREPWREVVAMDLGRARLAQLVEFDGGARSGRELRADRLGEPGSESIAYGGGTEGECQFTWLLSPQAIDNGIAYLRLENPYISAERGCAPVVSTFVTALQPRRRVELAPPGFAWAMARDRGVTYWVRQSEPSFDAMACADRPGDCALMRSGGLALPRRRVSD